MHSELISHLRKNYILQVLERGERIDGRGLHEHRPIKISFNVSGSAEGSARVQIGKTDVIVGIKMALGEPFPDTPNSGVLTTNAELSPIASPTFETGPPNKDSIELARVTDRAIRESGAINLEKLCITPGEQVWIVFIDIQPVDYDGNLFDASELGALAALMATNVPASQYDLGDDFPLPMERYPISCTSAKIGNTIVMDPNLDEENIADARLTVSTDENGVVRAMQKGLSGGFTYEEVKEIIRRSIEEGNRIREQLFAAAEEAGVR